MIFVDRTFQAAPAELQEFQAQSLNRLQAFFATDIERRERRWPLLDLPPKVRLAVKVALMELFKGRCAYCGDVGTEIDHFRPRLRAGRAQRHVDLDHYWWLSFEWSNLYLSCRNCNRSKGSLFPIDGVAAEPMTFGEALRDEEALLLDPCWDRPEEHLRFRSDGTVLPLSKRGEATVSILGFNDPSRVKVRLLPVVELRSHVDLLNQQGMGSADILTFLKALGAKQATQYLSAAVAPAIQTMIDEYNSAEPDVEYPQLPPNNAAQELRLPAMAWLESVEVRNFKAISSASLQFPSTQAENSSVGQPWMMLLGENGVGKSSLLQAVALASMPDEQRDLLGPASEWVSRRGDAKEGFIRLTFTDGSQRNLSFRKGDANCQTFGEVPASPVLAYGSTRILPQRNAQAPKEPTLRNVLNLFDQTHPLVNTEPYFCDTTKTKNDIFELLATSIEKVLPDQISGRITRKKGALLQNKTPLDQLSGGYKSVLALVMDIIYHMSNSSFDMDAAQGLILIDELELHLHPRWKIRVVEQLRSLFPKARFIVTSHDPLCVQGLQPGELNVFGKHPNDESFLHEQIDVPPGKGSDEVLTGPWFGMTSTIDSDTLLLMSEHSDLLQQSVRNTEQEPRLAELDSLLRERMPSFGSNQAHRFAAGTTAIPTDHNATSDVDQMIQRRLRAALSRPQNVEGDEDA